MESLEKRLIHLYTFGESHPDERDVLKAKLDGFIEAGLLLRHVTKEELQLLIDKTHLKVFGITREERAASKAAEKTTLDPDWTGYDSSPLSRKK